MIYFYLSGSLLSIQDSLYAALVFVLSCSCKDKKILPLSLSEGLNLLKYTDKVTGEGMSFIYYVHGRSSGEYPIFSVGFKTPRFVEERDLRQVSVGRLPSSKRFFEQICGWAEEQTITWERVSVKPGGGRDSWRGKSRTTLGQSGLLQLESLREPL